MIAVRLLRDGNVVREVVFRALPVSVGRGADCDFPLLDASVSRAHALIEAAEDGSVRLRDLDSRNGLHVGPRRVSQVALDERLRCRLGQVELEIERLKDAPTLELRARDLDVERRRSAGAHAGYLALGVVGWLALEVAEPAFWSPWDQNRSVKLFGSAIAALLLLPLVSAIGLVVLKAFGRKLRIADTLQAVARLPWLLLVVFAAGYSSYYPLSSDGHGSFRLLLGLVATVAGVLLLVSVRRSGPSRLFRAGWALAVAAVFVAIAATWSLTQEKSGEPSLDFRVQAPLLGWAGAAGSLDAYFERVQASAASARSAAEAVRVRQADR